MIKKKKQNKHQCGFPLMNSKFDLNSAPDTGAINNRCKHASLSSS